MIETSIDERRHPGQQHEQTDNNSRLKRSSCVTAACSIRMPVAHPRLAIPVKA